MRRKKKRKEEEGPPLVSCILPTHDRPDFLLLSLRCFQRQDYPKREILIIDDGPVDLLSSLPSDPAIRYFRLPPGVGLGVKRNYGCHFARGEYLVHWDDDDWSGPRRLSIQLAPVIRSEADITVFETATCFDLAKWRWWHCGSELRARLFPEGVNERTLLFHRRVWERMACYPEDASADTQFLKAALRAGARLARLSDEGEYIYVRHGASLRAFTCGVSHGQSLWTEAGEPSLPPEDLQWYRRRSPVFGPWTPAGKPLVTCIMPTADRRDFVPPAIRQFLEQDYPHSELLVVDAGRESVKDLLPPDDRIRYLRIDERLSLGALRNRACQEARGEIIIHWDDDDWIAPWRIRYQVDELLSHGADLCGLDRLHYVGPSRQEAWEYVYPENEVRWVAGGTLCYWKDFWSRNQFPDLSVGEDNAFVWSPARKKLLQLKNQDFYVALIHSRNTSPKEIHPERWFPRDIKHAREMMGESWQFFTGFLKEPQPVLKPRVKSPPYLSRMPLISCVMATKNRAKFLRQAIRCFLRQTYMNAELIVVDDGEQPCDGICRGLLNVQHIRCPHPMTLGAKLNLGVEQSRGEIIQKIDDDDYYGPRFLESALGALDPTRPDLSLAAWCCFLVLLPGEARPRFSGHGWTAGATLGFHRRLWERVKFRDVPAEVDRCFLEDCKPEVCRVCAPESLIVVRHGNHLWRRLSDSTRVDDFFRTCPEYPRPVADLVEPIDRAFYEALTGRQEAGSGSSFGLRPDVL